MWKVYNISSGLMIKAGFDDEEAAQGWLLSREELEPENYTVEEMDADEFEEWKAAQDASEFEEDESTYVEADHGDKLEYDSEDSEEDPDEGMYTEVDGSELDD